MLNDVNRTRNDIFMHDYSVDDNQIPAHTKKHKSNENLMENVAKVQGDLTEVFDGKSMALVPTIKGNFPSQVRSGSDASESSKKFKNENAGLLQQPRVQK